jgi:hypothetical protein
MAEFFQAALPASPPLFGWVLGSIESTIVFLVLAAVAAIYNKFIKKEEDEQPPGPPGRPRPGSQWTGGAPPRPPGPRPETRTPAPDEADAMTRALRQLLDLPPVATPPPLPPQSETPPIRAPLSRLDDRVEADEAAPARAALAYAIRREATAQALDEEVGEEIAAVVPTASVLERGHLQPIVAPARNPELMAALRNRDSLRQLIVASTILGPPKGLGVGERDWM